MSESNNIGRPSIFTDEIAELICERLANGESLASICEDDGMPAYRTLFRWLANNEPFRQEYSRAREAQADIWAAQTVTLSDRPLIGVKTVEDKDGIKTTTGDNVERSRLQVQSRQWAAARMAPAKYGDRLAHQMLDEHGKPAKPRMVLVVEGAPVVPDGG